MPKFGVLTALTASLILGLATPQASAQDAPPHINIPTSGVATGDVVTISGANFSPGSTVILKVTGPVSDSWSQSYGIGGDGKLSYPVRFSEEGMYKLEVLGNDGGPLTLLLVSAARHQ